MLSATGEAQLRDGRTLSYSTAGRRDGFPLLYFHGAIGSPINRTSALEALIGGLGIRYVIVERPGFGSSTPHPGRLVADFAGDIEQLADHLRLDRFSVVGISAGAPYAMACAWAMPDRVVASGAVSPIPSGSPPHRSPDTDPRYRLPLRVLATRPRLVERAVNAGLRVVRRHPVLLRALLANGASRADRISLDGCNSAEATAERFLRAVERGPRPMIEDYLVCCRDWGFPLSETRGRVILWHGALDRVIPEVHVRGLAQLLPNSDLRVGSEDGHFFFARRIEQILPALVATSSPRAVPQSMQVAA